MNQFCKKASFVSGLILLFSPIIFSTALVLVLSIRMFWLTFSSEQIILYIVFLIVATLEIIYFIKIFKAYRLHEPHAYYIIYFLGIITSLGLIGDFLMGLYQPILSIIKLVFFIVLLFSFFSFRHEREKFFLGANQVETRKNVLIFLILAGIIGIISYYISIYIDYFFVDFVILSYFLSALVSLALIPCWRKKIVTGILRSFIFFPGFCVVVTHLVLQLFIFYNLFRVFMALRGYSL